MKKLLVTVLSLALCIGTINTMLMGNQQKQPSIDPVIAAMIETVIDQIALPGNIADFARDGNWDKVKELATKAGINVNAKNCNGKTALMMAIKYGKLDIVQTLIGAGADVNAKNNDGVTTLMYAVMYHGLDAAQIIITNGADVNAKDNNGRTALLDAAKYSSLGMVQMLINNGADINAKDNNGTTALTFAEGRFYTTIAEYLRNVIQQQATQAPQNI